MGRKAWAKTCERVHGKRWIKTHQFRRRFFQAVTRLIRADADAGYYRARDRQLALLRESLAAFNQDTASQGQT